jgi:protein-S-isoprenylcysteine O-methyltransferase Ste14
MIAAALAGAPRTSGRQCHEQRGEDHANMGSSRPKPVFRNSVGRIVAVGLLTAGGLFGSAGTLRWWNAWVFLAVGIAAITALTLTVFRRSPDLVEERRTAAPKAKAWDRILVPLLAVILPYLAIVLAGLDRRFGWTLPIAIPVSLGALAILLAANALTFWAMACNRFFSSHVRIQQDRGHTVVSHGPYAYVRHPGYTGAILYALASPILLGSRVAFWASVASLGLWIVRTALEDRMLQAELAGYREYAAHVRYRLVPLVW